MSSDDKKQQVLVLTPSNEITFEGAYYTEVVTSFLNLSNPTNDKVIFKVKTTAPKQYCVRPNSGLLGPKEDTSISVMLQPFQANVTEMNKHKFMVQTMFAPPDFVVEKLDEVWKSAPKSELMDSKLRCVFVKTDPKPGPQTEEAKPPAQASQDNDAADVEGGDAYKSILSSPVQEQQSQQADDSVSSSATQPTAGSTPGPGGNKNVIESETKESKIRLLQDKVESLSNENTQLKSEANKLRQRLVSSGSVASSAPLAGKKPGAPQAQSSSPLSFVAIVLILVAIILGYLVGKSF